MINLELPALESAHTLQDLADRLSSLLGNPVTIEATDFELVAYSRQETEVDEARKLTILQRRVPEPVVKALFRSGIVDRITASNHPVRVPGMEGVGLGSRVAIAIRLMDRVFGHIWVQEVHRELTDEDTLLLQHAANLATAQFLRMEQHRQTRGRVVSDFLWELVTAGQVDPDEARERAASLQIQLPEPFRILIINPDPTEHEAASEEAYSFAGLRQTILTLINDEALRYRVPALAVREGRHLVLLVGAETNPADRAEEQLPHAVQAAAERKGYRLTVSASGVYQEIAMLPHAYAEASRCLLVSRQFDLAEPLATRGTLGALQFLPLLKETLASGPYDQGAHAKLARLLEEDQKPNRNFSFVETLEAYLDCAGDALKTAERLYIHVNTLNYRLRRITESSGLQLSDGIERLSIHLELKLRRLMSNRRIG